MEIATGNSAAAGTRPDEPISLLDDDDDDDGGNEKNPLVTKGDLKSPRDSFSESEKDKNARKKAKIDTQINTIDGCMLTPKNPIKIFTTDRDKVTRRRLRRQRTNISSNVTTPSEDAYQNHWSNFHCWTYREMLGFDRFSGLRTETDPTNGVGIDWIFITTYILNVDFLLNELPELVDIPIVVIVYQYKDESLSGRQERFIQNAKSKGFTVTFLCRDPRAVPQTSTNPLKCHMEYGCHHTKMTLVGYSSKRLRVHIHTSNLRREDVHDKCQGAFLQDFLPKTEDQLCAFQSSAFEESLVTYLESYDFVTPLNWKRNESETLVSHLQSYDFSKAVGVLVPSVPGYHTNIHLGKDTQDDKLYGYLKVQKAIRDNCCGNDSNEPLHPGQIVCQFSSMGSLSKPYLNKISDAWNVATAEIPHKKKYKPHERQSHSLLSIVWPTMEEIETSVEGPNGGQSVPGRRKNLHKDFLKPLLHKWRTLGDHGDEEEETLGKGRHVPHIKSYYQMDSHHTNKTNMHWFVLSSHNLSKAAWGEIQNRRGFKGETTETLVVQHWELGVFVSPSTLGVDSMKAQTSGDDETSLVNCKNRAVIPLPYKFKPDKYDISDHPWVVD